MLDSPQSISALCISVEVAADDPAVAALVLATFGPGRFAKTAERLREGAAPTVGFVAREGGEIVGSVRLWPIVIGETPALFLGPIAVAANRRKAGLGAKLVQACLEEARRRQASGVLMVGDAPYFGRFGFATAPDILMPGPVNRQRVLWVGQSDVTGTVRAA